MIPQTSVWSAKYKELTGLHSKETSNPIKKMGNGENQDGGLGRHTAPPRTIKEGQQFKNKKQPELTENQTVWKSNNQKEKK